MATPDSPDSPLTKGESDIHPHLSRSKLGKDLGRSGFSHAKAEHPWLYACSIGSIVLIPVFIIATVQEVRNGDKESILPLFYVFLILACFGVLLSCVLAMLEPISISETDDALFFLKLIAAGHSWDDIGRIMNSYFFERGLWWTNSYFYHGQQCYYFFSRYSKSCTDPAIQVFIEQAKSKLTESMTQQWDRIQLPDEL
ncbi:protein PRM9 [Kluyveromyces marxianus]|uniref:Protein PRM9 n=1 Tax=Kluyveromyces marxianus TaxID=4911 RepID=A0ABX6F4T8_KLUMA|nr:protein PRM9 [Kluyveromyces marxianus]